MAGAQNREVRMPDIDRGSADSFVPQLLGRVQLHYRELPGLQLTERQAERLWGVDDVTTRAVFAVLADVGFLRRTRQGAFVMTDAR